MAELSGLLWWNFAYTLILTRCSPRDCQMSFGISWGIAEKQWNWPCLLKLFEYFDKIMHKHCYWRELDRGLPNVIYRQWRLCRGPNLKNKWIWPSQLLEHFDMHLSKFWKKVKLKRTLHIFICKKKSADTLRYHIFVCNIGSAILHFRM